MYGVIVLFLIAILNSVYADFKETNKNDSNFVILQGLDKITARVFTINVPIKKTVQFGKLFFTAHYCDKSLPEDPPENVAFLEISEQKTEDKKIRIFSNWMFGSSPSASALEHPVYDIWVKGCVVNSKGEL